MQKILNERIEKIAKELKSIAIELMKSRPTLTFESAVSVVDVELQDVLSRIIEEESSHNLPPLKNEHRLSPSGRLSAK